MQIMIVMDSQPSSRVFKCRKCRHLIFRDDQVCNSHGIPVLSSTKDTDSCDSRSNVWYLKEENLPDWLKEQVDDVGWTKGKIFCPTCQCRIGSFDFVGGSKCSCGSQVLPSLHLVSSKLDIEEKFNELLQELSVGNADVL